MEESISRLLEQQPVDLVALRKIAHQPGGFQSHRLRVQVWPKLMGINRYQMSDYRQFIDPHCDDSQVRCDVERSLWNNHESCKHWSDSYREKRRKALAEIIIAILARNKHLYYYQGYHDLVSTVMLIVEDDHLAFTIAEYISINYMVDYMREDFDIVSQFMHFIFVIVKASDMELYQHMMKAKLEPFFATSWLITWFAHDLHDLHTVARLFDVLLSTHPIYIYYICAAYIVELKKLIINTEPEFAAMHNVLVRAPERYGFPLEKMINRADDLLNQVPINRVVKLCDQALFKLISANEIQLIQKPTFLVTEEDSDYTLLQKMELINEKNSKRRFHSWGWKSEYKVPVRCSRSNELLPADDEKIADTEKCRDKNGELREVVQYHVDEFVFYLLFKMGLVASQQSRSKQSRQAYRKFLRTSLFWSITAAISGILSYYALNNKSLNS